MKDITMDGKEQSSNIEAELSIFIDPEEIEELRNPKIDKIKLWYPGMNDIYISRWKQLNDLFRDYYPGEKDRMISSEKSKFATKHLRAKNKELADTVKWSNPNQAILKELENQRKLISEIEKSAPLGYMGFLWETDFISPSIEKLSEKFPDFFTKFPIGYWTDEFALSERHLSLLDFAYKLKEYIDYPTKKHKELFNTDVNVKTPFLKLKIGDVSLSIEKFWAPQILNSILEDIEKFFEELSPSYGIDIDIWKYPQSEIRKQIKLYMRDNIKVKGEKSQAYIVGNLVEILKWPGAKEDNVTTDSAEFVFRFLKIFDLDEERIDEIDESFASAEKDKTGKPIDGSSYNRRRNEVFQRCRVLKNSYDKLI